MTRRFACILACATACTAGSGDNTPATRPSAAPDETQDAVAEDPKPPSESEPEEVPGGGPDPMTLDGSHSTSLGSPGEGRLQSGAPLPLHGPGYRFDPRKPPERRHGTVELVQALVRAAGVVHAQMPGNTLTIGDLSLPEGGQIGGHASHRSGRDVDVMFYLLDEDDEPFGGKPIPLEPDGTGHDYVDLEIAEDDIEVHIDVPRTWAFVQALITDPEVDVARIFVVEHIRGMLLDHAEKIGAPTKVQQRFGHLTCQPKFPHDDHMHIRVFCTPEDIEAGCEDMRPIFPWHRAKLKKAGVEVVLAGPRKKKRPKLRSLAEARKKAEKEQVLHPDVQAFLDRRKAWAKRPHPGRKYCK